MTEHITSSWTEGPLQRPWWWVCSAPQAGEELPFVSTRMKGKLSRILGDCTAPRGTWLSCEVFQREEDHRHP